MFCLGTIQARTHVQLALACQQSMLKVQHRFRFTMQHVHGHAGNLGNECADHAAALGSIRSGFKSLLIYTLGTSKHFDTSLWFGSCNNTGDVLEKLHNIRTEITSIPQNGRQRYVPHRALFGSHACIASLLVFSQPFFSRSALQSAWLYLASAMVRLNSCVSTASSSDESYTTCGIP